MTRYASMAALEGAHERERVAHRVQQVHAVAGPEAVEPGDRGAHGDGAGADDESVVVERSSSPSGSGRDAVRGRVDAAGDGVEAQRHAGRFEVGEGAVGEVAPVGDLAGDVVGDAADGEVRVGVGDHDGDSARGSSSRARSAALMPASLPPIATSFIGAGSQNQGRCDCSGATTKRDAGAERKPAATRLPRREPSASERQLDLLDAA